MKIIVLGGAGGMSRPTVMDLLDSKDVSEVIVADINFEGAKEFVAGLGDPRVTAEYVDASNHNMLVKLFRKADLVINGTVFKFNLAVMKAALEARIHYLDLGGLFHMARKQLELDNDFKVAGLTAILGMASGPGTTNIMAKYAADKLDIVETINIRNASKSFTRTNLPIVAPYAITTLVEEFTVNSVVFENGEFKEVPPLSGLETIVFPDPVGESELMYALHSEVATLPLTYRDKGIKNVDFKIAFPPQFTERLKFLIDLGLTSKEPLSVNQVLVKPIDFLVALIANMPSQEAEPEDYGVHRVIVIGQEAGKRIEYVIEMETRPCKKWGTTAVSHRTGVPPSVVAQMILKNQIQQRGVLAPEECINPEAYFLELAKRDMHVFSTIRKRI